MTIYSLVDIRGESMYGVQINSLSMVDDVFSIGVTLDGIKRISDYELVTLAHSNDHFKNLFLNLGIEVKDDSAWSMDGLRGVSKEVTLAVKKAAGCLFIRELNLLHGINASVAKKTGIVRLPYKISGFLTDKLRTDPEVTSYVRHLSDFCNKLDTKPTHKIKPIRPRHYNYRKYSVDDINKRMNEVYLDAAATGLYSSSVKDRPNRKAVLEVTYQPISEYLEKSSSANEEISNGYVYYTRNGESMYFTHMNHVLQASVRFNEDKTGCIEIFDQGIPVTLIPRQDFEAHGFYSKRQSAALSIGSDNAEASLSKLLLSRNKEVATLKVDIEKLELENTKLKTSVCEIKGKLVSRDTKQALKDNAELSSKSKIKMVADTLSNTKVAILSVVAILGGLYTIRSYVSSE